MRDGPMTSLSPEDIRSVFDAGHAFVITTHVNADGDAIGSEYALARHLLRMGKSVSVLNASDVPDNLAFLNTDGSMRRFVPDRDGGTITHADAIFVLDLNDSSRLISMEGAVRSSAARVIVIDHHLHPKPFADGYLVDTDTCATSEILYRILRPEDGAWHEDVALGLYVGIMTDTGSFRFDRTTPTVHRITAELIEAGVDPVTVYRRIYDEYPLGRSRLLGMILAGIEPVCDGRATILCVTRAMFNETGTGLDDVENVVNYGLSIRNVDATALLTELDDGVKISFRSRGDVSIHAVAKAFGGGGHRYASGATVAGQSLQDVRPRVVHAFEELLRN